MRKENPIHTQDEVLGGEVMNDIFNTDEVVTCLDQVGQMTYKTERNGWNGFTTVSGTFWTSGIGVYYRKPRGRKFVFLCRYQAVIDFVPTEKVVK